MKKLYIARTNLKNKYNFHRIRKRFITFLFLISAILIFPQTQKEIEIYKSKFFLYPNIGTDSALIYTNKVFASKKDIDLAFSYTAKRHLLTITGKNNNDDEYVSKINFYLKKVPEIQQNYTDLSNIYNILGITAKANEQYDKALKEFLKADYFARKNNDIKQAIKIKGNIASIKLELKQTNEGIADLQEVLSLMEKNKNLYPKENFEIIYNNNISNLGHLYSDKFISDHTKNKIYFDRALTEFNRVLKTSKNKILIAETYLRLGTLYVYKNNRLKSSDYYHESLRIFDSLQLRNKALNVRYNIAVNDYELNKIQNSKKQFIRLSKLYEKDSIINSDYIFVQDYLSKIYLNEKNIDSAAYYSDLFVSLYERNSEKEKQNITQLYKDLNKKDLETEIDKIKKQNRGTLTTWLLVTFILGFIIIGVISYSVFQFRKKKNLERQLDDLVQKVKADKDQPTLNDKEKNLYTISNEKEAEIIEKLLLLEKKEHYLKPEFSQAYVAKKLGTNTAYLSQAINNYMKKTFSEYSNELRIHYILKELSENKKIRGYTTQALAEMIGYKNGNSFARSFKEKTGVTPFQYIDKLNQEE